MSDFFTSNVEAMANENFADSVEWEVVRTNERVKEVAEELGKHVILAVDTENSTIDPHLGWALLLQIGTSDKSYIFEHYAGLDLSPIKAVLEDPNILKVLFNAKYDWKWIFVHYGIQMNNIFCCQIVERLLTVGLPEAKTRSALRDVTEKYLGIRLRKEARSAFINRDPELDPITDAEFAYAAADTVLLPEICLLQIDKLNELGVQVAAQLEFDVLPVTAESEVLGVLIDQDRWRSLLVEAKCQLDITARKVYSHFDDVVAQKTLFGVPTFKISSTQQLLKNLERLGFELTDTEAGTLKKYKNKHEVFEHLITWRGYQKVLSTYGEKLLRKINPKTGRLHPQFNQVRAQTGRMSSDNPNCFSPDTEILTEHGWVRFDELPRGVKVAQWDKGSVSFVEPTEYFEQDFVGELVHISMQQIDLLVTPDHQCLVRNRKNSSLRKFDASNYPEGWQQLSAGVFSNPEPNNLTVEQVRFLVAAQADGSFTDYEAMDFSFKKERKIVRFRKILESLGAEYQEKLDSRGRTRFYIKGCALELARYFLGSNKVFGSWVLGLSRRVLTAFCNEVFFWDGCWTRENHYASSNKVNADWVQVAFALSGKRARLRKYISPQGSVSWQVDVTCRDYSLTTNRNLDKVPYKGKVYCVTVPSHNIFVRRNNCVAVTGQCQNIPGYDPEDPTSLDFRSCFVAKPGYKLITADFSQQELRILADMSGDPTFYKAYTELDDNGDPLDVHRYTAATVFEVPYKEVTKTQRGKAKTLNFFLVYGGGAYSLALTLKITEEEAEQIIADYFKRYGKIKRLLDSFGASALNKGFVQTISGRKRFLLMPPDLLPDSKEFKKARAGIKRQAGNTPIQGCLTGGTRVLTQMGYIPIATLEEMGGTVGVFTGTHYAPAQAVYKGDWESAKVTLQDGSTIRCDTRHKFLVPGELDYVWKDYADLQEGDQVCRSLSRLKEFYGQDMTGLSTEHRGNWWYWLGRYVGDGNIFYKKRERGHRATLRYSFGSHEKQAVDACVSFWSSLGYNPRVNTATHTPHKKESTRYSVVIDNKKLVEQLMSLGFTQATAHIKRIPQIVFELTAALRTEFIRGLFEADGWLPKGGTGNMPTLHLCQRPLLEDTKNVLHSLGVESSINGPYNYTDEFTSYRLDVCGTMFRDLLDIKYNNDRPRLKCPPPAFVLNNFRDKYSGQYPQSATKSDRALLRRIYSGGSVSVYTLKNLLNKFEWSVDYPLYVTKQCVAKKSSGQSVRTYTMVMSDPEHRFDAEGVITHNSGADVTKLAMVFVDARLRREGYDARILMVVHDELVVEAREDQAEVVAKIVEEEMVRAFNHFFKNIPMRVDAHIGPTWEK